MMNLEIPFKGSLRAALMAYITRFIYDVLTLLLLYFGMDGLSGHSPVHTLINYYNPVNLVYYFLIGDFLKTVFNKKSTYGIVGFALVFQSLLGLFVGAWMGA